MKKITFLLLLFLAMVSGTYAQVQVGEGTNEAQALPFEPYYEYSYGQSIYLASEINASGSITAIKWFYSGATALESSQQLLVFLGQTDKETFENATDFVDPSELTLVYSGGITVATPGTPGWVTIMLTTPFAYDGTNNLVVAVDESQDGYDDSADDFHNASVVGLRSIYAFSDSVNFDPQDPSNNFGADPFDFARGTTAFVPNIIFEGIQQACPNPTALGINNLTTNSASLKWAINTEITQYNVQYGEVGFELGAGIGTGNNVANPYPISALDPQTSYQFYVQAACGATTSAWVGPFTFTTPCDAIEDFYETFDEAPTGEAMPECWTKILNSTSEYAYMEVVDYYSFSGDNSVEMYNSGDANAKIFLVSPNVATFEDMRVKFRGSGSGYTVEVGTMTNPSDPSTFTIIGTPITLTDSYLEYYRTLDGATGNFVAIRHGLGGTYRTIYLDDVILEPLPAVAPECVTDLNVTPDDSCGNFVSTFEWSAVEGADGYKLTIGTTSGGNDAINAQDLGNVTSFSFVGNHNTTYYYSLVAYNASGDATGCFIDSFDTAPDGCYCESIPVPGDIDNNGITNVQIGTVNFPIELVTYSDNTEVETVDLAQAITANVQIKFETGYTYDTHVWIDFNDNYIFESNEKVFTGVSTNANPTVFNASFPMPENAALGVHRMRIGTADNGQFTPNPCYNESYGITLDFHINVVPTPACLPPTGLVANSIQANSANLNWISDAATFNVEYGETGFTIGEGTLVSGAAGNSSTVSLLSSNTAHQFYVQAICGPDSLSPWAGPFSFTTACDPFGDFEEDFATNVTMDAPECWSTVVQSTSEYAYVRIYEWNDAVEMYTSDDSSANLMLITPSLTDLPSGTHRIKFKAASYNTTSLIVGTMSDPTIPSTFTPISTIPLPNTGTYVEYTVPFATSTNSYVVFKHGGGASVSIYIDDVIWEPIPSVIPSCVEEVTVTVNEDCGNFASLFEWTAAEYADGYRISIGTTQGGTDVINNTNVGNVTAVNFTGDYNTTYFYTLTPYNTLGDAAGCVGGTFSTAETGCYCPSVPTSLDGLGITNVQVGDIDFINTNVTYTDNSEQEIASFTQGAEANVQITFNTFGGFSSYTYDAHVWIDFNDNYVFESSELVFSGESLAVSPTTLDATFTVPASAAIGNHRMRIGTADGGQEEPDPCYSGTYGVTVDFTVNIETDLAIDDFNNSSLRVYPNPVKDMLNLTNKQNISNVEVFNMLGQQVIAKTVNAAKGQVDMSNLATGTYLVRVATDSEVQTIKVIKQ